jgi:tetratricopeptide (TPR) repeat protein
MGLLSPITKMMMKNRALELKNEGNEYFKQGDYEKALQCYGKAVEIAPDYRDAWKNIYLTLQKQDRMEEAGKCKEIIDKLSEDPKSRPKSVGLKHFSLVQKIFIVIITILLVITVVVATEALVGPGAGKSGPGKVENNIGALVALSPVGLDILGNNTSAIRFPVSVDMVSGSFDAVSDSLGAISPIGLDMPVNNSSGTNRSIPS